MSKPSRLDLLKQGDKLLRRARCDAMTAAPKDRNFRRNKRAERQRHNRWRREKVKKLGTIGPASAARTIPIQTMGEEG